MKKTKSISFKLTVLFLVILLVVLACSEILTYLNQMSIYRRQCETDVRQVGEHLESLISADGADFAQYQDYYLAHYDEVDIPADADEFVTYRTAYEELLNAHYPGKTVGVDIPFEELNDDVKHAYLVYRHLYWIMTFEQARDDFDMTYTYYIVPDSEKGTVTYMIDGVRTSRAEHVEFIAEYPDYGEYDHPQGDEAEYLYLGEEVVNERDKFDVEWAAWESGEKQKGFQVWNNEFGHTYAYYVPLILDGQKLGLIGTEIDVATVNMTILRNTIRQFVIISLILTAGMTILVVYTNRRYIRKIADLEARVREFARTKDASVAEAIRQSVRGADEVGSLSEGVAHMIEEIRDYIDNRVRMHQELERANSNAARMSELALRDGLTGIRNRTAYEQEIDRLGERLAEEDIEFAIAMIDLNDLKKINDTYGHERGNEAIIKLAGLVCDTFKHSMVFRIGGDEFVVILLNDDYQKAEALSDQLKRALSALKRDDSLQPWEKISAAIGLARFERESDTRVEDVFRRADARMYEQKKEMKKRKRAD